MQLHHCGKERGARIAAKGNLRKEDLGLSPASVFQISERKKLEIAIPGAS